MLISWLRWAAVLADFAVRAYLVMGILRISRLVPLRGNPYFIDLETPDCEGTFDEGRM